MPPDYPILIVGEMPQVRQFVNAVLSQAGFDAIQARDGTSAIAKVREEQGRISLLLTEVNMDGMSGVVLAKSITAEYPAVPVLFMSGVAVSTKQLSRAVTRSAFIQKPFHPAALIQAVKELLAFGR